MIRNPENKTHVVSKTADQSVTNETAFQNDTHLYFPMKANGHYYFRMQLKTNAPAAADIHIQFSVPAACDLIWGLNADGTGTLDETTDQLLAASAADQLEMWIYGIIVNGANAGNFQLTWAQKVADATPSKILQGSVLLWTELS